MNHLWSEVNAAILAVLADWNRPDRRGVGRGLARNSRTDQPDLFVDRLLGLKQAEALADRTEVRILAGTVVTPMAWDLLKKRRIVVRVVSGRDAILARDRRSGEWGFAIESTRNSGIVSSLRRHWLDGSDWSEVGTSAEAAAGWVVERDGRGALVLADEASPATWRANRVEGVRAATVGDVDSTVRAVRSLGANLIVVEPASRSIHLLKQIGERFRGGGAPEIPDWLEDAEGTR